MERARSTFLLQRRTFYGRPRQNLPVSADFFAADAFSLATLASALPLFAFSSLR